MISPSLENLVDTGQLKREPGDQKEFDGLVRSGRARLSDAITVFLCLPHTLGLEPAIWRLLVHCHGLRSFFAYSRTVFSAAIITSTDSCRHRFRQ